MLLWTQGCLASRVQHLSTQCLHPFLLDSEATEHGALSIWGYNVPRLWNDSSYTAPDSGTQRTMSEAWNWEFWDVVSLPFGPESLATR